MNATSPGYIDLQVNGYGGVDFNGDEVSAESLHAACERLTEDGVSKILATIITADVQAMSRKLARIAAIRQQDPLVAKVIAGLHIEGPFINEQTGYVGAHPRDAVRPADVESMQRLLDAAEGLARIVTLAPERDPNFQVTRMLAGQGICVSGGHCNPSLDQLDGAIDAGLSMFTHLGNGCPLSMHRHDNIIQRALSRSRNLHIGLIADGVHVPWPALGNSIRCAGVERCFIVTDAISAAGLGPGHYQLGEREVVVDSDGATWAADRSHLVGSSGTMPQVAANLKHHLHLSDEDVTRLTVTNPQQILSL
ncbi:N-acetylglucosamine-6-phosphate deacetylase [Allorhodopirellula solitaria]|uniref:N-acetylglucosamine-6-phosphate deacetylase n=1 Tax=Allorhodopirellula solitaria TaxID=2527987 RepID=A0A5C5XQL7_9BACT|nr:N-acetylglucosamine-6-phosphate deacetylase [Allorhodopirellula solitaria]TWT64703.1 N-acetylglucosamine-6-phosphate deacetylase [Allorhodopirellula solitaria]